MLFLLFLCINLLVIEHGVGSDIGFSCRQTNKDGCVYLMEPSKNHPYYDSIMNLNDKFRKKCSDFYNIQSVPYPYFKMGVSETLNERDVVNLWAEDYYNYKSENGGIEIDHEKITYAGDIVYLEPKETAKRTGKGEVIMTKDYKRIAKVMSDTVANMNNGDLLEFIESIQYNGKNNITSRESCTRQATYTTDLRIVLICTDEWKSCFGSKQPNKEDLHFKVVQTNQCGRYLEYLKNNLLAVLAPKPFDMDYEISVPTIFYETPYMNSEIKTYFPNSMNLISGSLLKYAFMKFINDAKWHRVGIISDDSPYSEEFEKGLLDMFHEEGIIYKVRRCKNRDGFEKAVVYFHRVDTKIVIVNADERNSKMLMNINSRSILTLFVLLFRVPQFWTSRNTNRNMHWFSISMAAEDLDNDDCSKPIKSPACAGVVQGLSIVSKAHTVQIHAADKDLQREKFYRNFTETMKKFKPHESTAHVRHVDENLLEQHISKDGVVAVKHFYKQPFKTPIPDQNECLAKVNNFERPCDYSIYIYIMLVIMMFAITVLIITCYFHETSPLISKRYQQL